MQYICHCLVCFNLLFNFAGLFGFCCFVVVAYLLICLNCQLWQWSRPCTYVIPIRLSFFIRLTAWCTNCSSLVNSNGINSPLGFSYIFDFWVSSHLLGIPSRIPTMYKDMEQNFIPLWSVRYYNTQVPIYSCRFLWITQNMIMIYVRESYPWRIVFLLGTEWTSS